MLLLATQPLFAQGNEYSLFDRFSIALEGSFVTMDTNIRLDSTVLDRGTELDFEDDGGLSDSKTTPSIAFDWRIGRRHRVGGWWLDVDRDNTQQILEEIRFGDQVFEIDELVNFGLGNEEFALSYTYFPVLKNRHAFGVGGGLRTLRVSAVLAAVDREVATEGDFTGPLPFVLVEYQYGVTPTLRLVSDFGVFYIEIGEFTGSQLVLDAYLEHLTFKNVAFGFGARGGRVDIDVEKSDFRGLAKIGIFGVRAYVRVRF
jgi:hypothetical protein